MEFLNHKDVPDWLCYDGGLISLASTFPTILHVCYALEFDSLRVIFLRKIGLRAKGELDSTLTH